jgi:hypothetical protein
MSTADVSSVPYSTILRLFSAADCVVSEFIKVLSAAVESCLVAEILSDPVMELFELDANRSIDIAVSISSFSFV